VPRIPTGGGTWASQQGDTRRSRSPASQDKTVGEADFRREGDSELGAGCPPSVLLAAVQVAGAARCISPVPDSCTIHRQPGGPNSKLQRCPRKSQGCSRQQGEQATPVDPHASEFRPHLSAMRGCDDSATSGWFAAAGCARWRVTSGVALHRT